MEAKKKSVAITTNKYANVKKRERDKVMNVKVKHIRPHGFHNLEEWVSDLNNVYIGRQVVVFINKEKFPKQASPWANPFRIGKDGDRDEVLTKYEEMIRNKLNTDESLVHDLLQLKDKNLGCWCKPERCHGDILLQLIEEYHNKYYYYYNYI